MPVERFKESPPRERETSNPADRYWGAQPKRQDSPKKDPYEIQQPINIKNLARNTPHTRSY